MSRLPSLRPRAVIAALEKAGFATVRVRGSHHQLLNASNRRRVTVPYDGKDQTRATIAAILQQAGLTEDEFRALL